jgi:hypothetical protein
MCFTAIVDNDGRLDEHTSKPAFWILGILTVVSGVATIAAGQRDQGAPPYDIRQPRFTAWLRPYITSRLRQAFAISSYLIVMGLQMLEIQWVGVTGLRWIQSMLDLWPRGGLAIRTYYALSTLCLTLGATSVVAIGGFFIMCQVSCLLELAFLSPGSTVEGTHDTKVGKMSEKPDESKKHK